MTKQTVLGVGVPLGVATLAFTLAGCAADMVVTPAGTTTTTDFRLTGKIVYEGDRKYLPRTLLEASGAAPLIMRYSYTVTYDGNTLGAPPPSISDISRGVEGTVGVAGAAAAGVRPDLDRPDLLRGNRMPQDIVDASRVAGGVAAVGAVGVLLAQPTGKDTVAVIGRLEILKGDALVRTYMATAELRKTRRRISEGETLSELRRLGLMAVRDSIEAQMVENQEALLKLLASEDRGPTGVENSDESE